MIQLWQGVPPTKFVSTCKPGHLVIGMGWLQNHPKNLRILLKALLMAVTEYVSDQVQKGAWVVKIFGVMGIMINDD